MTLGDVGKASSSQFVGKRKLLLVPLMNPMRPEQELNDLVATYWREVGLQVRNLEASLGTVACLFHEGVGSESDAALADVEKLNGVAYAFLRETVLRGAIFNAVEDPEGLKEAVDLQRCLMVVQESEKVMRQLYDWFIEARRRRYEEFAKRIDEALAPDAVGLLIISPDHQVQFPPDIQVFYVSPPSYDAINRWLRDHPNEPPQRSEMAQTAEEASSAPQE